VHWRVKEKFLCMLRGLRDIFLFVIMSNHLNDLFVIMPSRGYDSKRGNTNVGSCGLGIDVIGEDEIQKVGNDGSVSVVSYSPTSWVPGERHLNVVLHFSNVKWTVFFFFGLCGRKLM